ncbi:unnamed protein product [Cylicocyclus nassatus]|uniref:Uncharacterized protein n=1 Tax=Cylicocyclus nassatus TaxID=53992 RepID=A0AA36GT98_CYLNA|nr:unnamed protein product [Cylicocyclus nassatus]
MILFDPLIWICPAVSAGYMPTEDDKPINTKVKCEDSCTRDYSQGPLGYINRTFACTILSPVCDSENMEYCSQRRGPPIQHVSRS